MNGRWFALAAIAGLAGGGALGCRRLVSSLVEGKDGGIFSSDDKRAPFGKKSKACELVTDAEIDATTHSSVVSHKGDDDSCDWTMKEGGTLASLEITLLPPVAARVIPQFGKVVEVPGLGDKAQWTEGPLHDLRVQRGGIVLYILATPSESAAIRDTKMLPGRVISRQTGPNGTQEVQEVSMDNQVLKSQVVALAQAALKRM